MAHVSAAAVISCVTSSGWDTIATWLEATSMVVAPIRLANIRSASGGIAWSRAATMDHDELGLAPPGGPTVAGGAEAG